MLLILTASVIPMDREIEGLNFITGLKPSIHNLLHVPAYAILSILLLKVLGKRLMLVIVGTIVFGMINEWIQLAIPGRYPGLLDIGLNTIGALVGIFLFRTFEKTVLFSPLRHTLLPAASAGSASSVRDEIN
jgi:glycopeptide antibiotics resistance protein